MQKSMYFWRLALALALVTVFAFGGCHGACDDDDDDDNDAGDDTTAQTP